MNVSKQRFIRLSQSELRDRKWIENSKV